MGSSLPPLNQPPPSHANAYRSGPQLYARATPMDGGPPTGTHAAASGAATNTPPPFPLPNTSTQPPSVGKSSAAAAAAAAAPEPVGPVITVFVGNISERAPEPMIKKILAAVGTVISWKRVSTFGFCEYE